MVSSVAHTLKSGASRGVNHLHLLGQSTKDEVDCLNHRATHGQGQPGFTRGDLGSESGPRDVGPDGMPPSSGGADFRPSHDAQEQLEPRFGEQPRLPRVEAANEG